MMIELLESVRRTIYRWVNTTVSLTQDVAYGDTTVKVTTTRRFRKGDEVAIHDGTDGEPGLHILEIVDDNTLILESPIKVITGWRVASNAMLTKTYNGQFVQAIYINDPPVIPAYPAITILGRNRSSEWLTLGTTKERYDLQIAIYVQSDNHEQSYRTLLQITDIIQLGLKKNIFPLVGPYDYTNVTANVASLDEYIKVADTSKFNQHDGLIIENIYHAEEVRVREVVDSTTLRIHPTVLFPYLTTESPKAIKFRRFIYNSWPATVEYGFKVKETLLHAATISWFAEEQEDQTRHGWSDPQLT